MGFRECFFALLVFSGLAFEVLYFPSVLRRQQGASTTSAEARSKEDWRAETPKGHEIEVLTLTKEDRKKETPTRQDFKAETPTRQDFKEETPKKEYREDVEISKKNEQDK